MDMTLHVIPEAGSHCDLDDVVSDARVTRAAPPRERTVFATAWYHDAAIEDARRDAIEARSNPYGAANLSRP